MAQRTIHYLLGELLLNDGVQDRNRFRVGNLLPDAYEGAMRKTTHFIGLTPDGTRKYSDFERFRTEFSPKVELDDLYLGYYMHLVEDACFRVFVSEKGIHARIRTEEHVQALHRDYHILNRYITEHYGLRQSILPLPDFAGEEINRIYPFRMSEIIEELSRDFQDRTEGNTVYMTEALLDEFVSYALPVCRDVLHRLRAGNPLPNPLDYSWNKER